MCRESVLISKSNKLRESQRAMENFGPFIYSSFLTVCLVLPAWLVGAKPADNGKERTPELNYFIIRQLNNNHTVAWPATACLAPLVVAWCPWSDSSLDLAGTAAAVKLCRIRFFPFIGSTTERFSVL